MVVIRKKKVNGEVWEILNGEVYRKKEVTPSGGEITVFKPLAKVGGILHGRPEDEDEDDY